MNRKMQKVNFTILATDVVVFRLVNKQLEVLLVPVTSASFKKMKALPGGLVGPKETAEDAAERYLKDKCGISDAYLEQLYTFSDVNRDPVGRVVSVAYMSLIFDKGAHDEGKSVFWRFVKSMQKLAYDHNKILETALERLRSKITYTTVIKYLLPKEFTFTELQNAYESILGIDIDKRNFRKKINALKIIETTGHKKIEGACRPAELYRFTDKEIKIIEIL